MSPPPPPVPKPRARYTRDSLAPNPTLERNLNAEYAPPGFPNGVHQSTGSDGAVYPTLAGISDLISTNIPSMAGMMAYISGSAAAPLAPTAPPSVDSIANNISSHIPSLADAAHDVAEPSAPSSMDPAPAASNAVPSLDSVLSSLAKMPTITGVVSHVANPAAGPNTSTANAGNHPSLAKTKSGPHADVGALSNLVMSALDPKAGVTLPPLDVPTEPSCDVTMASKYGQEDSDGASLEELDSDSSNEEEDMEVGPGQTKEDPPAAPAANLNQPGRLKPSRPAPKPPRPPDQSKKPGKQKIPRAATIRVSRKKGGSGNATPKTAVVRADWLDVWKRYRHSVLWATLDGNQLSLWKKRTDRFSEMLFHTSSITNVKKQDKGRFSIYFHKKHYDFMAHSEEIQDGWVTSLQACRGQQGPAPPELQGQITIKDTRTKVYAAVLGHDLWIYPNKDSYQLGIASYCVPLNVSSVKSTGKHTFSLVTPYKTFNLSVDSSKDLSLWLDGLSATISSALSSSQVALRLWTNPYNKVCGDCGAADPEWASVNLLMVICHSCAGPHRALGTKLSKVRSLKMDNKVWTEPLMQLFVAYGNRLANQVWAPAVPAAEQLSPDASDSVRSEFIQKKYNLGRYKRLHALAMSPQLMGERLREVVCSNDIEETMSLICSGAKVCQTDPQVPSSVQLAERAGQALQVELLRLNEYTEVPPHLPKTASQRSDPAHSDAEEEELHGKLEEDRFLFSFENNSAACDVLDLREVLSVFVKHEGGHQFEIISLEEQLVCATNSEDDLLTHLVHILKVILPGGVSYAEVGGATAVSKACVLELGGAYQHTDAWLLLWEGGVSIHPTVRHTQPTLQIDMSMLSRHEMNATESTITMVTRDRCVTARFEDQYSCQTWYEHLKKASANQSAAPHSLYPVTHLMKGSVSPAIERCISHVTNYGLKVEGVYRRCGLATKVSQLVEGLMTSPSSTHLESDEQGVLDAASALKKYIRQKEALFPEATRPDWVKAAVVEDERSRFSAYRRLLRQLPDDNRATMSALFGHFYLVQVFSQVNKMSAQNLALVLVPSLFDSLSQDLLRLIREFIIHHTLLFLTPEKEEEEVEQITAL
ncbi:arf-GAP with Rho-GAP domain, ANK repeat and PH domain-containing protein 1 isoform 1-T1 [Synchiropus picturatus]